MMEARVRFLQIYRNLNLYGPSYGAVRAAVPRALNLGWLFGSEYSKTLSEDFYKKVQGKKNERRFIKLVLSSLTTILLLTMECSREYMANMK